jgi:F-type H+-transporting ATPase subunit alpha
MENIRPAEVSELLKKQIEGFTTSTNLEEVGTVLQVGDGIARVYGLQNVRANELVEFETCKGVVLNLEQDNVGVVLLGSSNNIKEGEIVKRTGRIASVKVGDGMLGRVINTNGEPLS